MIKAYLLNPKTKTVIRFIQLSHVAQQGLQLSILQKKEINKNDNYYDSRELFKIHATKSWKKQQNKK